MSAFTKDVHNQNHKQSSHKAGTVGQDYHAQFSGGETEAPRDKLTCSGLYCELESALGSGVPGPGNHPSTLPLDVPSRWQTCKLFRWWRRGRKHPFLRKGRVGLWTALTLGYTKCTQRCPLHFTLPSSHSAHTLHRSLCQILLQGLGTQNISVP